MKHLVKVIKENDREAFAERAGFLNFADMKANVEGMENFYEGVLAGDGTCKWMVDIGSENCFCEKVEWVKSIDGNCNTSTLVDKKGYTYGTWGKTVLGYIHGNPNGGTYYREVEVDCYNRGLDEDETDYALLEEIEDAPEYKEDQSADGEVELITVEKIELIEMNAWKHTGDQILTQWLPERSDAFVADGVVYEERGEVEMLNGQIYGKYCSDDTTDVYIVKGYQEYEIPAGEIGVCIECGKRYEGVHAGGMCGWCAEKSQSAPKGWDVIE